MTGEAVVRLARDPSPPILTPVRFQATPVLSEDNPDNAEQRQEQSIVTSGPGNLIHKRVILFSSTLTLRRCDDG